MSPRTVDRPLAAEAEDPESQLILSPREWQIQIEDLP